MSYGPPMYMTVLDYQMQTYVVPSHKKVVEVDLPPNWTEPDGTNGVTSLSRSHRVIVSLSTLYPGCNFTTSVPTEVKTNTPAVLKVRSVLSGTLHSQIRGLAIVGKERHEAIYLVGPGLDGHSYRIEKEDTIDAQPTAAAATSIGQ
jgi:hypothetical protein